MNKSDGTLTIMTEKHDNLTASATDNLSDEELNVMDEVELSILTVRKIKFLFFLTNTTRILVWIQTFDCIRSFIIYILCVLKVNDTKKAVRLRKLPKGSVTFNQKTKSSENISGVKDNTSGSTPLKDKVV